MGFISYFFRWLKAMGFLVGGFFLFFVGLYSAAMANADGNTIGTVLGIAITLLGMGMISYAYHGGKK